MKKTVLAKKTIALEPLIRDACEFHEVDYQLVSAIVDVESAGDTFAARYEPKWKYLLSTRAYAEKLVITELTEEVFQSTSWGLMQVMGSVAREHGFNLHLQRLCEPRIGLEYGMRHLKKFLKKYPDEAEAVSSYNAGSPRKTSGGMFENQRYVDRVYNRLVELRKLN